MIGSDLLSVSGLKERGWTLALIKTFLGEPDTRRPNPFYRKAAPVRLYKTVRVETIEATPAFQEAKEKTAVRSARGKSVAARMEKELIEQAGALSISVGREEIYKIRQRAIESYNCHQTQIGKDHWADENSDPDFLRRIMVNYIRHNLTTYDHLLEDVAGKVGVSMVVVIIRRRILVAIAKKYPQLADECWRQSGKESSDMTDFLPQQSDIDRLARELHAPHRLCPFCRAAVTLADQLRMNCPHCRAMILPGPITPERGRAMLVTLEARRAAMGLP